MPWCDGQEFDSTVILLHGEVALVTAHDIDDTTPGERARLPKTPDQGPDHSQSGEVGTQPTLLWKAQANQTMQNYAFSLILSLSVSTYEQGSAFEQPSIVSCPLEPQERVCGSRRADASDSEARYESMSSLSDV